ncbi:hypothetical protein Amet_2429 [Alkaliphilus metalliredigens QYMF]|uniref:DUF2634 domain-containing protein n=1 Tax=Alkaliphilus metalliredigens (strain QYMF) TaxID=293826 RepID=A6TQW5_ALKMQ|nr:DUF2634 domain-containing protein [Alkaliphilus metalliredigens]ABR48583.1 hypothetical protein Amet_2429 [Alkaliphilus metalliredigens QYMF]
MLPQIANLEIDGDDQQQTTQIGKSFLFDFNKGEFVFKDGKLVPVEGIEALKVWIEKTLRTEKFRFKVYEGTEYGVTVEDLIIGHNYPISFAESEVKREVSEALGTHPWIERLVDWGLEREKSILKISFRVILVNGNSFDQVVNYNV